MDLIFETTREVQLYTSGLYYKSFYNHNDSGQYNQTMNLANFALARSVNYVRKEYWKLNRNLHS